MIESIFRPEVIDVDLIFTKVRRSDSLYKVSLFCAASTIENNNKKKIAVGRIICKFDSKVIKKGK